MNAMTSDHYVAEFSRVKATLPGQRLPWLKNIREEALTNFRTRGFPTLRDEDWKYTSVAQIEKGHFELLHNTAMITDNIDAAQINALALSGAQLLVFVDGHYASALSRIDALPIGITVASLSEVLAHEPEQIPACVHAQLSHPSQGYASGFTALNAACMADGAYVHLTVGTVLDTTIQLLFITSSANLATHCRNLVFAERDSRVCIVEHHATLGAANYFTNVVTDIVVERGAEIEHHKLQQEGPQAFHVATVNAILGEKSRFISSSFALGSVLARTDIQVVLNAEGAECALDGLYIANSRQHIDHHTRIDHVRPGGTSREFYKGVMAGASHAVFNGKVIVHPNAQKSDASQTNRNLLLSKQAEVDTKPQLEIWADDVKCSHGATVGPLDDDQIFYLRSRGVSAATARTLLTYAFVTEMVDRVRSAPLRNRVDQLLHERLPQLVETLP